MALVNISALIIWFLIDTIDLGRCAPMIPGIFNSLSPGFGPAASTDTLQSTGNQQQRPFTNPNIPPALQTAYPLAGIGGSDPYNLPRFGGPIQGGLGLGKQLQLPFFDWSKGTNVVPTQGFESGNGFNVAGLGIQSTRGVNWSGLPFLSGLNRAMGLPSNAVQGSNDLTSLLTNSSPFSGLGGVNSSSLPVFGGSVPGGLGLGSSLSVPFFSSSKGTNIVPTEGFATGKSFNVAGIGITSSKGATWGMLPLVSNLNQALGLTPNAIFGGRRKRRHLEDFLKLSQI
uniref:Uncharacterized protein n=1 Tax=Romanomermis culicivorax TaxID=13658 RepID=A0A915JSL4_ROMCU